MAKPIALFGLGLQGKSPTVTSQRRVNLYYEFQPDADKTKVAIFGTPGLSLFTSTLGDTPVRGWISDGDTLYVVHRGTFWSINNAGVKTSRGTLSTTSGRVSMAFDGAVILIVDGTAGYTYTLSGASFATIADADFPNGANTCDWLDGQFIVDSGDGSDVFHTSPDGTNWDALDIASAESAPDGLVRVFVDHGELLLFGETTTEPWGSIGASFPFAPIKGSISPVGLAARWTLAKHNDGVAFLGKSTEGEVQVMHLTGYTARPISSQELDSIINGYDTVSDATAFAYKWGGHPMYQINFPSEGKSWLYDASTTLWSELQYGLDGERHRGELHIDYLNKPRLADYETGSIYTLDDVYTDNGTAIVREIVGRHIFNGDERFPISELYVDFETGVGLSSGQGSDPQVMLQISKDNGHTWGNELWKDLGAIGRYLTRVEWRRLGLARDWLFKLRITDPIKTVMTYAAIR